MDDLIQRPDVGVKEAGELRVFLAGLVSLPVTLLDLVNASHT